MVQIWLVVCWSLCFSSWVLVVLIVSLMGMLTYSYKSFMSKVINLY